MFVNTHVKLWGRETSALARKSASAQLEEASGGAHFLVRETNWSKWRYLQNCPSNTSTHIQVRAASEIQLYSFLQGNTSHITNQYFSLQMNCIQFYYSTISCFKQVSTLFQHLDVYIFNDEKSYVWSSMIFVHFFTNMNFRSWFGQKARFQK